MRKFVLSVTLATLMVAPVQAADWQSQVAQRPGAFVGARVQLPLGGKVAARPRATLTIAPTLSRMSSSGVVRTTIGEGIALNFSSQSKPTLTLAGLRADHALGLSPSRTIDAERKQGLSTAGWIAVGVGVALIGGGLYFAHVIDEARDNSE